MESIQSKLSVSAMTAYLGIFKEPRGLIRALQLIFAIFAFATACNGSSSAAFTRPNAIVSASWSYPYNLKSSQIQSSNGTSRSISDANDVKPSAQFFVFTGVMSMILALAFILIYILLDRQYRNDERFPIIDLFITIIWAIFWFAGSSAWAKGVSNIRSQTSYDAIKNRSGLCPSGVTCQETSSGAYANIIVSVIFGYLNFVLWIGTAWFVYKETKFFKSRTAQPPPQMQPNTFADIGSPNMQQSPYIRSPDALS